MYIAGTSVLENEINGAKNIEEQDRRYVRIENEEQNEEEIIMQDFDPMKFY